MYENYINISMKKNQVIIKIDENAEQRDIISELKRKMLELKICIKMTKHQY